METIKFLNYQINCLIWFIVSINARSSQGNMDCPYFVNVPLMIVINIDQYNAKQFRVKSSKRWLQHSSEIIILVQIFKKYKYANLTHTWDLYAVAALEFLFFVFVGGIEGSKCISEGAEIQKFAKNGWFWPFLFWREGGGRGQVGAEPPTGGKIPPCPSMPPLPVQYVTYSGIYL